MRARESCDEDTEQHVLSSTLSLVSEATRSPAAVGVSVYDLNDSSMECLFYSGDMRRMLGGASMEGRSAQCFVHPADWKHISKRIMGAM